MAKRVAERELTQENWDQEDEEEEAGHFRVASSEDLSKRKIIKAKRRVPVNPDKQGGGIFQGFSGFAGLNSNTKGLGSSSLTFKPLTGISSLSSSSSNMFSSATSTSTNTTPSLSFGNSNNQNGFKAISTENSQAAKEFSSSYNDNIKALNESVSSWIQKHIKLNPYVDLTPIFNDYKEHMKNIDQKFSGTGKQTDTLAAKEVVTMSNPSPAVTSSLTQPVTTTPSLFTAPSQPPHTSEENKSDANNSETQSTGQEAVAGTSGEETNEDEVPKPRSVVVAEEGAFHSIKCKMFFKRDSSWSELGIGMLNLKKLEGKTQVLVRNDTTLGKILLNIYLAESTPITRSGKNNVILMCVPNPPLYSKPSEGDNSKPATYLIRVKTAEDADELFSQLNKSKTTSN
ncbi:unnamed protein product [Porites evermanni]|uniref:RanBD1 domain-containing protein n=1 Tax=Porites evermanni TaxID=104178 RepID=A0ABN8SJX3_9CNID|nr:unnamed protein product [Porites evermanni]